MSMEQEDPQLATPGTLFAASVADAVKNAIFSAVWAGVTVLALPYLARWLALVSAGIFLIVTTIEVLRNLGLIIGAPAAMAAAGEARSSVAGAVAAQILECVVGVGLAYWVVVSLW